MNKKISLLSLVLLIVAGIDSIRNLPSTALFGSSLPFFFLLSAVMFLIPVSLISAEFASRYPEEGGVFPWVRHAFGGKIAFLAVWLQWINTMVWYPTILSFIAGTAAYLVNPELAQSKTFLVSIILTVFWALTFVNLFGLRVSTKINSYFVVIGNLIPMALLIGLGVIWIFKGNPIEISFTKEHMFPSLKHSSNWVSLVAIMASFLGMELSGVHVNDIQSPERNFPKALGFSVLILTSTMLFGALSIAVVTPETDIRLVDGIMQTFVAFFDSFHMRPFVEVLAFLIIVGSVGNMINWLVSPAKGLLQAAGDGFLPTFFTKKNRHGVAVRILITQALLVSLFCLAFILLPSINAFYWFLTALSTELYVIMYVILFLSAWKLGRSHAPGVYKIPKGLRITSIGLGILGCLVTIVVSFFLPDEILMPAGEYALLIGAGNVLLLIPYGILCLKRVK